jgi:hypothetical protein
MKGVAGKDKAGAFVFWTYNGVGFRSAMPNLDTARKAAAGPELYDALKEITPPMPEVDALCHLNICPQRECAICGEIKVALEALAKAEGRKAK